MLIREGTEADLPDAYRLIQELAIFEKEPNAVVTSVETMKEDGFGAKPVFGFFVAESESKIVGLSLYYDRYSTWRGRCLYLEDLIVNKNYRGQGIGKALLDRTIQKASDEGYQGMSWQVLDWNETAIDFYKRYKTNIDAGWLNCSLSKTQLASTETTLK